ncbi:hypothetical protein QYE76_020070 [Lolium multiflorum]|uniref:F-box domain-containing protein n=1 Tax=Lolium multiflorum TaxID=4521 RepID=A0AAD8VRT2_LOLMU|nr:hypothetical protein QYE76_020070 [Lolium multiflorum]
MAMERYIPTDTLVEILLRLPPSSLRRARLVCRRWRDVVNKHTTEMQSRPRPLIWSGHVAYVVGDLSPESTGSLEELWRTSRLRPDDWYPQLVGTCNGLLCLCDNEKQSGGSLTVVNPATGETLPVPPLPCGDPGRSLGWHAAYNFAYHPTTGKYKVVHVPCSYNRCYDFETLQLLTLGETTWRDVSPPAAGARCRLSAGIVSIDGVTHWVKVGGDTRIVSFDLDAECFASTAMSLPRLSAKHGAYNLTEVHGRLGFVSLPDVWVLEQGRQSWSHRYKLQEGIPCPHFVYGDCVLIRRDKLGFYGHWPKSSPSLLWGGVIHIGHKDHGTLVATMPTGGYYLTFAYVHTIEPLNAYMPPIN